MPSTPSRTSSAMPPRLAPSTGTPAANASSATSGPVSSQREGTAIRSYSAMRPITLSGAMASAQRSVADPAALGPRATHSPGRARRIGEWQKCRSEHRRLGIIFNARTSRSGPLVRSIRPKYAIFSGPACSRSHSRPRHLCRHADALAGQCDLGERAPRCA